MNIRKFICGLYPAQIRSEVQTVWSLYLSFYLALFVLPIIQLFSFIGYLVLGAQIID